MGDVCCEKLTEVWSTGLIRINNGLDSEIPAFDSEEEIVERAFAFVHGQLPESVFARAGYNVMTNNCEHFATWVRNGWAISQQVTINISCFINLNKTFGNYISR